MQEPSTEANREQLLADAIDEFTQLLNEGHSPRVEEFVTRYADCRESLEPILRSLSALREDDANQIQDSPRLLASPFPTLGDYRLLREVGRGGMGIVYEAEQLGLGRLVAVKVLPLAGLMDERQLDRFKNETRAAAMLKHPNIVSVYSVGCERGVHYYAMELVLGHSLAEVIATLSDTSRSGSRVRGTGHTDHPRQTPPSAQVGGDSAEPEQLKQEPDTEGSLSSDDLQETPDRKNSPGIVSQETASLTALSTEFSNDRKTYYRSVARLGIQAAGALHYAHGEGVIHRDIKPSNLLLDANGKLWITDFGLARVQSGSDLTRTGDLVGTLRYMSPERMASDQVADQRCDVYGLGLTLYELVARRPAIVGESRERIMREVLDGCPPRLQTCDRFVPDDLTTIIHRAIERDPGDRYATADHLAEDLQRFLDHRAIMARPTTSTEQLWRWVRRNPVTASLITLIAVLLAALTVGSVAVAWRSTLQGQRQELAIYARDIRLAKQAITHGNPLEAERILKNWVPANAETADDHRGFEWYYLWQCCHDSAIEQTIAYRLPVFDLTLTDDDARIAVGWTSPTVDLWNRRQFPLVNTERQLQGHAIGVSVVRNLHHTSDIVVGDADGEVVIWDPVRGKERERIRLNAPNDQNRIHSIGISDDDRLLAIGVGHPTHGSVHVWDRQEKSWVFCREDIPGGAFADFGNHGELILACACQKTMQVRQPLMPEDREQTGQGGDTDSPAGEGRPVKYADPVEFDLSADGVTAMAISADRRQLVVATTIQFGKHRVGRIDLWDPTVWTRVASLPLGGNPINCLGFSPSGTLLAAGDDTGIVYLLDTTQNAIVVKQRLHSGAVSGLVFSSDSSRLVTCGNDCNVHVWHVAALHEPNHSLTEFDEGPRAIHGATFVDTNVAAISDAKGHVDLWDTLSGQRAKRFEIDNRNANMVQLAASVDHQLLAVTCGHWPPLPGAPGTVTIIDLATEQIQSTHTLPRGIFYSGSSFSADGRHLALCCYDVVTIIDVVNRKLSRELPFTHSVKHVAFSPDGRWLACSVSDGNVHMLDARTFRTCYIVRVDSRYSGDVCFSPDSRTLAVVGFDNRIRLFGSRTGSSVGPEFPKCAMYLATVRFSADGQRLVTGAMDGKVRIWDVASGEELLSLDVPQGRYPKCQFSKKGDSLLVGCGAVAEVFHAPRRDDLRMLTCAQLDEIACRNIVSRPD